MNVVADDEDYHEEVFLDESDIIQEITVDNEPLPGIITVDNKQLPGIIQEVTVDNEHLPDADYEPGSDGEAVDEDDDSMHTFTGHTGEIFTIACSPTTDGTLVATGGGDNKAFLWKFGRGDLAFELQGHKNSVSSLAFSSDGQLLASGSLMDLFKSGTQILAVSSVHLKILEQALSGSGGIEEDI